MHGEGGKQHPPRVEDLKPSGPGEETAGSLGTGTRPTWAESKDFRTARCYRASEHCEEWMCLAQVYTFPCIVCFEENPLF